MDEIIFGAYSKKVVENIRKFIIIAVNIPSFPFLFNVFFP
jgi:hypothetical protein